MPTEALWSISALFPILLVMHVPHPPAMPNPCCSAPPGTSSHLLLLQAAVPKSSLPLWLQAEAWQGQGALKARESLSQPGKLKMVNFVVEQKRHVGKDRCLL